MRIFTLIVLLVLNGHCSALSQEDTTRPNLWSTISAYFAYDAVDTQALSIGSKRFAVRTLVSTLETFKTGFSTEALFSLYLRGEESKAAPNTLLKIVLATYIKLLPFQDKLSEIIRKLDGPEPTSPVRRGRNATENPLRGNEAQAEDDLTARIEQFQQRITESLALASAAGGGAAASPQTQRNVTPKPYLRRKREAFVQIPLPRNVITRPEFGTRGSVAAAEVLAFDLPYFRDNPIARLTLDLLNELSLRSTQGAAASGISGFQLGADGVITLDSFAKRIPFPDAKSDARDALFYTLRQKMNNLKTHLRSNLIGQDLAIDGFVNGLFDHYKSLILQDFLTAISEVKTYNFSGFLQEKRRPSCVLILGPSGTGKTEMFNLAMRFLGNPYGTGSGTDLTKAGYVGGKPEDIVKRLIASTENNFTLAEQRGALFIDEVDKLAVGGDGSLREFALGAQHSLLTLIEGSQPLQVEAGGMFSRSKIPFKTDRLLVVMAGAFSRLIPDVAQEERAVPIRDTDLINYGLCRELVNRIHTIVRTMPLEARHFLTIMSFQHSPLFQVLQDFSDRGIQIGIEPAALEAFAKFSQKQGFGARNIGRQLLSIVEFARNQADVLKRDRARTLQEQKEKLEKLQVAEQKNPSEARQAQITKLNDSILAAEQADSAQPVLPNFTVTAQHIADFIEMLTERPATGHLSMFL